MIDDNQVKSTIESFAAKLPRFPDGRINYSKSNIAPVITVFVVYDHQVLLLKRSKKVRTYKQKWNTIAGYLDDPNQSIKEKMLEELNEEVNITKDTIEQFIFGKRYQFTDTTAEKTWIVHPTKVILKEKPVIHLDWEHTTFRWIHPKEITRFDTVPMLKKSLSAVIDTD